MAAELWSASHLDELLEADDALELARFYAGRGTLTRASLAELFSRMVRCGAVRCVRCATPWTGPMFQELGVEEWETVRGDVMAALDVTPNCSKLQAGILELLHVPWLTWTRHMRGLLFKGIEVRAWPLVRGLIARGFMEGDDFGAVLVELWDMIDDRETPQADRSSAGRAFDQLLDLLRSSKDESLLDAMEDSSSDEDTGGEQGETDDGDVDHAGYDSSAHRAAAAQEIREDGTEVVERDERVPPLHIEGTAQLWRRAGGSRKPTSVASRVATWLRGRGGSSS